MPRWLLIVLILLSACTSTALADERILDYTVNIEVKADGSMDVIEGIRVRAEGRSIRRGIYRDFPVRYKDKLGNRYRVAFDVAGVTRDGAIEPYHLEKHGDYERLYIGSRDYYLDPGDYRYEIRYTTTRQMGFFDEHDELYWNAIPTGWAFPIDDAEVIVNLPGDIAPGEMVLDYYTGRFGAQERGATVGAGNSQAIFTMTRRLMPYEGMSVVVAFPKGIVTEPTTWDRFKWLLQDNKGLIVLLLGLIGIVTYYIRTWSRIGRDPEPGVIVPRWEPPEGLSPAACRYISKMRFDQKAMTTAMISLGVKGLLRIDERGKDYILYKEGEDNRESTSRGEFAAFRRLFLGSRKHLDLDNSHSSTFIAARTALAQELKKEYHNVMFKPNLAQVMNGFLLGIVVFFIGLLFKAPAYALVLYALQVIILLFVFAWLMRAPTPPGRKVMDQIDGFRMYLETAEKDDLNLMKGPEITPEVFEEFLPYAFALDVANEWSEKFKSALDASLATSSSRRNYNPSWYSGGDATSPNFLNNMGSQLNSGFNSALRSASTPPGSSSGSGGGGSSGGGGGGGGGGGW